MSLTTDWVRRWMETCARNVAANETALTELDTVIGDGDHGKNLTQGFAAVEQRLGGAIVDSPKRALRLVSYTLLAAVGGAAGPLYGTAFLHAARSLSDDTQVLEASQVAMLLVKAAEGIAQRGKVQPGQKTMLDAWYPAATNAAAALAKGGDVAEVLAVAAEAAAQGAEQTISMAAVKGRAALLGERSIGHKDPGAASTALILAAAAQAAGVKLSDALHSGASPFQTFAEKVPEAAPMSASVSQVAAKQQPTESAAPAASFGISQAESNAFKNSAMRLLADDTVESNPDSGNEEESKPIETPSEDLPPAHEDAQSEQPQLTPDQVSAEEAQGSEESAS